MASPPPRTALAQLVAEHYQRLYRYGYRLTGQAADAEDLVQQCFLTAQEKFDQLRQTADAGGWLCAILRTTYLRNVRRPRPLAASGLEVDVESIPAASTPPIDREALQGCLNELPPEFKVVVLMFYFEHQSYRQIAELLDLPVGTVMSRLSRAKSHLRRQLLPADEASAEAGRPLSASSSLPSSGPNAATRRSAERRHPATP